MVDDMKSLYDGTEAHDARDAHAAAREARKHWTPAQHAEHEAKWAPAARALAARAEFYDLCELRLWTDEYRLQRVNASRRGFGLSPLAELQDIVTPEVPNG